MHVSAIVAQLGAGGGLPRAALLAARMQRREMAPHFTAEIEKYLSRAVDGETSPGALFFMFHLLGSWRETRAYPALARLLRMPEGEIDEVLGNAMTETCHRVIAAVFDGNPQPIYDIVLDAQASEWVRSAMCEALAILVWQGRLDRAEAERFLRDCFMHLEPQSNCMVWMGWQEAIAILGLHELSPLVQKAFQRGYIGRWVCTFEDFQERLQLALLSPSEAPLATDPYYTPFGDTIEELSHWYGFSAKAEREKRLEAALKRPKDAGRNDPCPCGSGKKYKKCCLQ